MPTREIMEALQAVLPRCVLRYLPERGAIQIDYRMGERYLAREVSLLTLEARDLTQTMEILRSSIEHDIAQEAVRAFRAGEQLAIHPALGVEHSGAFASEHIERVRREVEDRLRANAYPYLSASFRVQPPAFIDEMKIDLGYGADFSNLLKEPPKPIPSRLARIPYDD
jgi:hypothetical protein